MTNVLLPPVAGGQPLLDVVRHCSAETLLDALPDEYIDAIITDPPYGIEYESSRTTRMDGTSRATSGTFGKDEFDAGWLPNAARVLKSGGALYLFTRWDVAHRWKDAIESAGLKVVQRIVWDKCHWGMGDLRYFGSQVEDILFAVKCDHPLRWDKRGGNVWRENSRQLFYKEGNYDHPTQKPVNLMARAVILSTDAGDVVADPFCGSGSTLVAAQKLGRHFVGCDVEAYYVEMSRARLAMPYTLPMFG